MEWMPFVVRKANRLFCVGRTVRLRWMISFSKVVKVRRGGLFCASDNNSQSDEISPTAKKRKRAQLMFENCGRLLFFCGLRHTAFKYNVISESELDDNSFSEEITI
jgi:hypothetical protein